MRKTKVIGFSIPPEIYRKFESVLKGRHKTKSEFFREVLDTYFNRQSLISESDIAHTLKNYWDIRSSSSAKTIIIGLGIIVQGNKVLIGARKDKDIWVENLSWVFPGGKIKSLNFEKEIKGIIKEETNIEVVVKSLIASRIHPDSGFKDTQIVALYFYCEPSEKKKEKGGGSLSKLKWIVPSDIFKYFTTSVTDDVTKFLMAIEKADQN